MPIRFAIRYASLFFIACVDSRENALLVLEVVHHYVEVLDKYFGNVCELDLIFNFHKVRHRPAAILRLITLPAFPVGRDVGGVLTLLRCAFIFFFAFGIQAYYLLDEVICGGELQESSKKAILRVVSAQDALTEESGNKPSRLT